MCLGYTRGVTAIEVTNKVVAGATTQLKGVFKDMPVDIVDLKLNPGLMSAADTAAHLCEVYTAVLAMSKGEEHAWGTYVAPTSDWAEITALMWKLRAEAIEAVAGMPEDKAISTALDYIAGHDFYHVGQMVGLRIAFQPDWNSYSIYGE